METNTVYNYQSPRQFLLDYLSNRQKTDPNFSVRKWAKEMGLKTHSLLVMLLQNKREIRIQHCDFLCKGSNLDTNEKAYFKTLVQYKDAQTIEEKNHIATFLQDIHPGNDFKCKEITEFSVIANWVHMAILAMTQLRDFKGTEEEVAVLLKGKITITEIRSAMIRLMDLKLIKWNENGILVPTYNRVTTRDDINNEGAKEYHRQVLDLAKNAIDNQDLSDREFQSFTMAVSKDKIPLIKEMIRKFRAKLSKVASGNGDNVYQTSIQFFQLTHNPNNCFEDEGVEQDQNNRGERLC